MEGLVKLVEPGTFVDLSTELRSFAAIYIHSQSVWESHRLDELCDCHAYGA